MSYVPEWELLSDIVVRVVECGLPEGQARQQLAAAIADRVIRIQVWVTELQTSRPWSGEVRIPSELTEKDFDWGQSRPVERWWFPQAFNPGISKLRNVDRVKVSTRDVGRVFNFEKAFPLGKSKQPRERFSVPETIREQERPFPAVLNRGREPGKIWNAADEPHFESMKKLLDDRKARSVADAARQVVEGGTITGHGTFESTCKRLERGYRKYANFGQ
jgi:hypothetical protein